MFAEVGTVIRFETKYKERRRCSQSRALRLRRLFRTQMLLERGDEKVRRKEDEPPEEEDGVSLEYRLAPRDPAVDSPVRFAISFSILRLLTSFLFLLLSFFSTEFSPFYLNIYGQHTWVMEPDRFKGKSGRDI